MPPLCAKGAFQLISVEQLPVTSQGGLYLRQRDRRLHRPNYNCKNSHFPVRQLACAHIEMMRLEWSLRPGHMTNWATPLLCRRGLFATRFSNSVIQLTRLKSCSIHVCRTHGSRCQCGSSSRSRLVTHCPSYLCPDSISQAAV